MAAVYILYSVSLDKFYIGSCLQLNERLIEHKEKRFKDSFTAKVDDWVLYFFLDDLEYQQARNIEAHIKKMKSRKYIEDLKRYPEIVIRLKNKYFGADRF